MLARIQDPDVREALRSCRAHFVYAAIFDAVANVLLLAYPLYMFNVFSRVLETRSIPTLVALLFGFAIAVICKALFEWVCAALFLRASIRIDRRLTERLVVAIFRRRAAGRNDSGAQVLRDLDAFRTFVTGRGGGALLDAPWAGLFLGILILLDPIIGLVALLGVLLLALLEVTKVALTKSTLRSSSSSSLVSYLSLDLNLGGAEAVVGMGMLRRFLQKWTASHDSALATETRSRSRTAGLDSLGSAASLLVQGVIMAVAAYQVIIGEAAAAAIFAAVLLFSFAMRPLQRVIAAWTEFIPVRQGLARIEDVLMATPPSRSKMALPRPAGTLTVKGVTYVPAGFDRPILRNINFGIRPGESLGVVGLIGSGKTTLARLLVGCIRPSAGHVRLDEGDVWDWAQSGANTNIGYLPQAVALLPATVAENIGHFGEYHEAAIVKAAQTAGAHELILRLPRGYDTLIGEGGHPISGGQRQLIGLARAVVGPPSLVVLDEPNANLDGPSEEALLRCIASLKELGTTLVMISHKPSLVGVLDKVLLLKEGQAVGFGNKAEVYDRLERPTVVKPTIVKRIDAR